MPETLFATDEPRMKTTALVPWFGSNRMLGHTVGEELRGCKWVGVPFAGGMCELAHIKASTIVVSDLHRHVINLAMTVANENRRHALVCELSSLPFHPDTLKYAQSHCEEMERAGWDFGERSCQIDQRWALNYFTCCWMGRSAKAGTEGEFSGGLPVRWNANGGDSNTRFRSAVASLEAWGEIMRRCNFVVMDVFEFLERFDDQPGHGLYCDPPFPGPGDDYKHKFTIEQHRRLAKRLGEFSKGRVVCRFYDHPLIRELYPEGRWTWRRQKGRKQTNEASPEVLIINGPSYAEAAWRRR